MSNIYDTPERINQLYQYKRSTNVWTDIKEETLTGLCGIKENLKKDILHFTPKPIEALKRIILAHTNEKDVVFEPTIGSGSTIIACLETNRQYIGFEIDPNCFQLSNKRIVDYHNNVKDTN